MPAADANKKLALAKPRPESGELDAFAAETAPSAVPTPPRAASRLGIGAGAAVIVALAGIGLWTVGLPSSASAPLASPPAAATGSLRIETDPAGAEVRIAGLPTATTPATFTLAAGSHAVVVRHGELSREMTVSIRPGADVVHQITWSAVPPPADAAAAPEAAAPASRAAPALVAPGWITVQSQVPLQIYEGGRLIGISEADRIMLPAGEHTLELAAAPLGFRTRQQVRVTPNGTTRVGVELPRVPLSINAIPWADVSINGSPVGQTPIGNLPQPIGTHDVEFRHPQLGTKRTRMTITMTEAARVAMDMRTP